MFYPSSSEGENLTLVVTKKNDSLAKLSLLNAFTEG